MPKTKHITKHILNKAHKLKRLIFSFFWFFIGFSFTGILLSSFTLFIFQNSYRNVVYPGIFVERYALSDKTQKQVEEFFKEKNNKIANTTVQLSYQNYTATISAADLKIGYNAELLSEQAYVLGRSKNIISNLGIILNSYLNGTSLRPSYTFSKDSLKELLNPIQKQIYEEPVEALFAITNGKVTAFRQSRNGKTIDFDLLSSIIEQRIPNLLENEKKQTIVLQIPIETLTPLLTTDKANNLGIIEEVGVGKSTFSHSIPNRIHNVTLAASKLNGILVPPSETFSFNQALGDVSKFTGYKEAYIIKEGRTVLGDGGGVCQVSTTLFRALLNAGLPIIERHAHAYRVGYYEQDSPPGLDATVYSPSFDLRFKNDTGSYILLQSFVDLDNLSLTFVLYGKKDGREVNITNTIVTNQTPAPPPLYQDDPTLPKGVEKQVDFSANGASVYFERTVKKDGKILFADKFKSNYIPWQAVYLRGTKEN